MQTETHKNPCDLDLDLLPMTLIFSRILEVVKAAYMFVQNFIKLNAAVRELYPRTAEGMAKLPPPPVF